jgi:hypothetical protein
MKKSEGNFKSEMLSSSDEERNVRSMMFIHDARFLFNVERDMAQNQLERQ